MPGTVQIKQHLEDAWKAGKLSHAYIISGGTGDERRGIADHIAQLLLTYRSRENDRCEAWAKQLASGTHPDLIRITHEKPAIISVDEIREQLSDTVDIRPYETEHKLYIIDEAEKMTAQAQNAALKTIEEPPEYASIVMLTENPGIFLETIRSRCVNLKLDPEDEEELISQEHAQILKGLTQPRVRDILDAAAALKDDKDGIAAFIGAARIWLRDVLALRTTGDEDVLLLKSEAQDIRICAGSMSLTDIERSLKAVDEAQSRIESNVNTELTLQLLLMALSERSA